MLVSSTKRLNNEHFEVTLGCFTRNIFIQVENITTHQVWQDEFSDEFIEDLSRKTGSFVKFATFCSILKTAVKQVDPHVYFDVLTFSDLENMRNEKFKGKLEKKIVVPETVTNLLNTKIYLVVTRQDGDQKTHYPLSLPPTTCLNVDQLQSKVKHLEMEIVSLKNQISTDSQPDEKVLDLNKEINDLKQEVEKLKKEKLEMSISNLACKQKLEEGSDREIKEINRLKIQVNSLEKDLRCQSKRHNELLKSKVEENHVLVQQIDRLKQNERHLKFEVKKLNEQLASYRRSRPTTPRKCANHCWHSRNNSNNSYNSRNSDKINHLYKNNNSRCNNSSRSNSFNSRSNSFNRSNDISQHSRSSSIESNRNNNRTDFINKNKNFHNIDRRNLYKKSKCNSDKLSNNNSDTNKNNVTNFHFFNKGSSRERSSSLASRSSSSSPPRRHHYQHSTSSSRLKMTSPQKTSTHSPLPLRKQPSPSPPPPLRCLSNDKKSSSTSSLKRQQSLSSFLSPSHSHRVPFTTSLSSSTPLALRSSLRGALQSSSSSLTSSRLPSQSRFRSRSKSLDRTGDSALSWKRDGVKPTRKQNKKNSRSKREGDHFYGGDDDVEGDDVDNEVDDEKDIGADDSGLSDIDARIIRLQRFMNDHLP